jgi:hypothetical protein
MNGETLVTESSVLGEQTSNMIMRISAGRAYRSNAMGGGSRNIWRNAIRFGCIGKLHVDGSKLVHGCIVPARRDLERAKLGREGLYDSGSLRERVSRADQVRDRKVLYGIDHPELKDKEP